LTECLGAAEYHRQGCKDSIQDLLHEACATA
jgi:hypothetical protein